MNVSKYAPLLLCGITIALLSGCAASVKTGGNGNLSIPEPSKQNLTVNLQGSEKVEKNHDWAQLKQDFSDALQVEASHAGYKIEEKPVFDIDKADGIGITLKVSNFRYLSRGARYGAGVMVGNAWVNSTAEYYDLRSGQLIGVRTYDTSSSAWEGVMSAMTQEQVQAIAKQVINDIKKAKSR